MGRKRSQHPSVHRAKTGWYFRYRVDCIDGTRKERTKYLTAKGKREAENLRDEFLADINKPEILLPAQQKFGVILDRFIESLGVADSSAAQYRSIVAAHIRPRWGDSRMCDIEQMDVEAWLVIISRTMAEHSFSKVKTVFKQAWLAALRWGFTRQADPISLVPKSIGRARPPREHHLPTEDQMNRLLAALPPAERLMAHVMMFTGLRASEAIALRWCDVTGDSLRVTQIFEAATGKIVNRTKTFHSRRDVPISHLRVMLTRPPTSDPQARLYLKNYRALQFQVESAAKAAGCHYEGIGCHMFRRWHNTNFILSGGSESLAMAQLGHTSAPVNRLYMLDPRLDERAAIAEKLVQKVRVM